MSVCSVLSDGMKSTSLIRNKLYEPSATLAKALKKSVMITVTPTVESIVEETSVVSPTLAALTAEPNKHLKRAIYRRQVRAMMTIRRAANQSCQAKDMEIQCLKVNLSAQETVPVYATPAPAALTFGITLALKASTTTTSALELFTNVLPGTKQYANADVDKYVHGVQEKGGQPDPLTVSFKQMDLLVLPQKLAVTRTAAFRHDCRFTGTCGRAVDISRKKFISMKPPIACY